ncbi:RHS repeat domain-containing protein, partial [Pseudomonas monachiensis]|uniref:RHS repeat domain-containing protein n=2 Tax=Pseudomonas monachiensis TaxID=3060212 RepID=UPI0038F7E98F
GTLTSCFGYDAMGRKSWQFASRLPAEKLSRLHNPGIQPDLLVEHAYNPIHRRHQYDPAGELTRTLDKLRGEIKYEYEANGQLHSRDAAANRLNFNTSQFDHVKDNRLKRWRDQEYAYDAWGNLIEKRSGMGTLQTFVYDCENRLVKAETPVNGKLESTGSYRYDSLGRRVAKVSEVKGKTEQKHFLWQGLRMLREERPGQSSLYLYEPGSYAPLARVDQAEDLYLFSSGQTVFTGLITNLAYRRNESEPFHRVIETLKGFQEFQQLVRELHVRECLPVVTNKLESDGAVTFKYVPSGQVWRKRVSGDFLNVVTQPIIVTREFLEVEGRKVPVSTLASIDLNAWSEKVTLKDAAGNQMLSTLCTGIMSHDLFLTTLDVLLDAQRASRGETAPTLA